MPTRGRGDCMGQREDATAAQAGQRQGGRREAAAARAGCARKACCFVREITQTTLQRPGGKLWLPFQRTPFTEGPCFTCSPEHHMPSWADGHGPCLCHGFLLF